MVRDAVLGVHVLAGSAGLLLGPAWLLARLSGAHGRSLAVGYQAAVAVAAVTGAVLALAAPGLAWLLPVAVLTEGLAVAGALARRRGWPAWRTLQPHLLGGSYLALVTALLVAETGNPVFWVLPAVVGQVPIALAKRRLHATAAAPGAIGRPA
ncbi:hypothetical protein DQ244_12915 [Blastococcus sp. TBT05-19]|uniref:hypothetical protein n=1 Tax=Blastococcus sp. TBT05-19 TaxID=2250581 RepID=UPI000DEB8B71|nr:hypothetical protein [Blastococcus sp. TBT05-19]RBY90344.1 hypothetical protein DQ244_12915 [Blastococcus sp. TBT05-19]